MAKKSYPYLEAARSAARSARPVLDAARGRALVDEAILVFVGIEQTRHQLRGRPEALAYPGMVEWLGLSRLFAIVRGEDEREFLNALRGSGLADIPSQESIVLRKRLSEIDHVAYDFAEQLDIEKRRLASIRARLEEGDNPERLQRLSGALRAESAAHQFEDWIDISAQDIADYAIVFLADERWDDFSPFEKMDAAPILQAMTKVPRSKRGEAREKIERGVAQLEQTDQFVDPRRLSLLRDALTEQTQFDALAEEALNAAATWDGDADQTSLQLFDAHFRSIPRELRPFAHELKQRAPRYYGALAAHQSRAGQTLEDLFPINPSARGRPQMPPPSEDDAAKILADRRRRDRDRKAAARKRVEPS